MKTPEFDVYLAVLGRSLRLSTQESRELSAELSDHFEERLADLIDAGVERTRAVRMVLDEFGEAAELAARFTDLAESRRRRRWIVRTTLGTCAAAAGLAAFVMLSPAPAPIVPPAVAQNAPNAAAQQTPPGAGGPPAAAAAYDKFVERAIAVGAGVKSTPVDPTSAAVEEKLDQTTLPEMVFVETPLREVVEFIADRAGVDVIVDPQPLANAGLSEDLPLTFKVSRSKITARSALELLVERLSSAGGGQFDFVVRNGVVMIAVRDDLNTTRIYDCRGVIEKVGDALPVVEAIQRNVAPDSWRSNSRLLGVGGLTTAQAAAIAAGAAPMPGMGMPGGGMGAAAPGDAMMGGMGGGFDPSMMDEGKTASVSAVGGLLVITQTPRGHRQIADLLKQLDAVLSSDPSGDRAPNAAP